MRSSIESGLGEYDLSTKQLEAIAANMKQRHYEHSANYHHRQIATNYEDYRQKHGEDSALRKERQPESLANPKKKKISKKKFREANIKAERLATIFRFVSSVTFRDSN